ncbi:epidermal growth factor receptor substrate 15-like [Corticium candelabrum]|uniref:epidermal growth factor receptor substrate 15-like n=1 Tax=Corticium candelabrum TaxID=121492 RepID=UPI002E254B14|nr:epidermal growth factor receptor substrate 15-like [Corticium candelabrum]
MDVSSPPTDWFISDEEKSMHITVFYSLNPENGVIPGERCRELFAQSKLPADSLSHIWRISDVDGDGSLSVGEFTVAMHLINARLSGRELPPGLPPAIRPCMDRTIPGVTKKDYDAYVKAFNELDRNGRGSLTAEEAKSVFIRSQLLTGHLAHVWNLADYDHDGNLTVNEFVIATHLMRFLKSGNQLPSIMDVKALLPEEGRQQVSLALSSPTKERSGMHLDVTASDETDMPTSKGKIQRGKWMTFSSKKSRGMFNQDELSKPVDSTAAFSPTSGNAITNDDEALFTLQDNPFAKDTFIPVDTQPRRVSVTSLDSTTSIEPFEEDPFKSCDPFSMSIPVIREDPFEANASDPFGTEVNDPFGDQNITHDPFSTSGPDVFANSSFPSKPFDVDQSPHISSSANNQTVADDKFENAFGSAPFMDQNPATFSTQTDPFAPIGSKPEETSECENPFKENAFVQPQSSTNDSFSASVKNNPDTSTAQTNENLFGDSFSDTITRTTNQTTDPFGVSLNTNQQSEGQTSNPFEDDKFQPLSTNDSFASNDVTPSVADPFTCGAVAPSVEDNPSNPLELDAFVPGQIPIAEQVVEMTRETDKETATAEECVGNVDDSSQKGDHHVTFADDSKLAVTFETYSSSDYMRKDPTVDPQRAELEVIHDEHKTIKHGLDEVETHLVRRLSEEIERERNDPEHQHVKFKENVTTVSTYASDEYERKDDTVDPDRAAEEYSQETGKKMLIHKDSVSAMQKAQQEERRRKQLALQQQLIAEIDLEWEENERTVEYEIQEAKEKAKQKFLAETEAARKREEGKWQQKLKEKEEKERKANEEEMARHQKKLEEAERNAAEVERAAEEKRKEEERKRKEEQEQEQENKRKIKEMKEREEDEARKSEAARQEEEARKQREEKAQEDEKKTQTLIVEENQTEQEASKGRKGLAARWEALAGGQKKEPASRQNHNEALERRKREEAELLRRQQDYEKEKQERAEEIAQKQQQKLEAAQKEQLLKEQQQHEDEERRQKEDEEKQKQAKNATSQLKVAKKHTLAKQWEEKFSK